MKSPINRREFTVSTSVIAAALLMKCGDLASAATRSITEKRLVQLGINGLARAAEMNYFKDGHRAAALISAHMMCVDNKFEDTATTRIVELFDRNWAKGKLCAPFPEADPLDDAAEKVGKALAAGGGVLREVGHDAIFAMHAIKAFRILPQTATPERVEGVCKLIRSFKPWRDIEPDKRIQPPPFSDEAAASKFILQETSEAIERFVGFGQGFAGHMLTFGQALVELAAMGNVEWAESCRTAFRKYVTVTRKGPEAGARKIKNHKFTKIRPDDAEYWQKRGEKTLGIGHVFKYPYAYYDLVSRAKDPELAKQFDAKAWHVF